MEVANSLAYYDIATIMSLKIKGLHSGRLQPFLQTLD